MGGTKGGAVGGGMTTPPTEGKPGLWDRTPKDAALEVYCCPYHADELPKACKIVPAKDAHSFAGCLRKKEGGLGGVEIFATFESPDVCAENTPCVAQPTDFPEGVEGGEGGGGGVEQATDVEFSREVQETREKGEAGGWGVVNFFGNLLDGFVNVFQNFRWFFGF